MTQEEFEAVVKQYLSAGVILYIVEPQAKMWLNPTTRHETLQPDTSPEMRKIMRLLRDTAISGYKLVSLATYSQVGASTLDREVDIAVTVGFDVDGNNPEAKLVIKKWRCFSHPIPSPGEWDIVY